MAWGYIREMPITREHYGRVDEQITNDPEGLILHASAETDGGVLIVDIWESKEANERFERETLLPALERSGMTAERVPSRQEFDVHQMRGRAAHA